MASRHRCSFHCGRVRPADRPPPGTTRKSNLVDHMQPGDSQQVHTFEEPARNTPCSTRSFSSRQRVQSRMKPVEQPSSPGEHCTLYVALHPLRGATPDVGRYTRSEEVQCLRIGCSATFNKHFRGRAITPIISQRAHHHLPQALHPIWGATPDVGHCTRCGALRPLRRATPDVGRYTRSEEVQCLRIGCSAQRNKHFRGGALPTDSASAHLPPSP